jgi:hypothetical protein
MRTLKRGDVRAIVIAIVLDALYIFTAEKFPHAFDRYRGFGPEWDCSSGFCFKRPPLSSSSGTAPSNSDTIK